MYNAGYTSNPNDSLVIVSALVRFRVVSDIPTFISVIGVFFVFHFIILCALN